MPFKRIVGVNPFLIVTGNNSLTWSYSQASKAYSDRLAGVIKSGMNAAAVFRDRLPEVFKGVPVIDGDKHDLRFLDPAGVIVGLKAKGKAVRDKSGFVIDTGDFAYA